ncbi:MAG: autotransporter domain-containing protein [Desulfobacteraceae bacterium]
MKRWLIVVLLTGILSTVCLVENLKAVEVEGDLELINGYRVDDLDWNIAGDTSGTTTPNIRSELTWRDLESYQLKLGGKGTIDRIFYLRGSLNFGWGLSGQVQDSDYNGDNRTQEYSRSISSADDSTVFDATVAFGYPFKLASDRFRLIPLAGFSYSEQNLTMKDGTQVISEPPHQTQPIGPIAGLDSTYDTKWYGPWVGVDLSFRATDKIILFAGFEYHWADYEAQANWNLRTDLSHPKSFEHEADGTGFLITAGGDYAFAAPWSLGLELNYQDWSTDAGIDRQFNSDGTLAFTRLNEVNWESLAIMLRVTYRFHYFYHR